MDYIKKQIEHLRILIIKKEKKKTSSAIVLILEDVISEIENLKNDINSIKGKL